MSRGFNTTIVWVRLKAFNAFFKPSPSFNTTIVWVRQSLERVRVFDRIGFQYNDCLGSSVGGDYVMPPALAVFQYNDCLGSSIDQKIKRQGKRCFNTTIVWVRRVKRAFYNPFIYCFNTTIVWVRQAFY